MKLPKYISRIALAGVCVTLLAGCNTLTKSGVAASEGRIVKLADGRQVVVAGQKQDAADKSSGQKTDKKKDNKKEKKLAPPKAGNNKKVKGSKGKKSQAKAQTADREVINQALTPDSVAVVKQSADSVSAAPLSVKLADDFSLNGEWTIYSVRGNLVSGEERPYVTFDLPVGRFYGNNGCNYVNGDVTVGPNRAIKLTNMISTMKMCQDDSFQYLINLALADVVSFASRQERHETFLDMADASGRTVLVLRRHNMDFLNGAWKVTELNGTPLIQEDDATMTFDTDDLKIHGTTGCNIFNGELFIDPDKTTSLQILKLATTRMACPPDSRETEFLLALESVETAKPDGKDTIALYDQEGNQLFKMVKIDLRNDEDAGE